MPQCNVMDGQSLIRYELHLVSVFSGRMVGTLFALQTFLSISLSFLFRIKTNISTVLYITH